MTVEHRGAEPIAVVSGIAYDEHRRRSSVNHGNGTRTTYEYDPITFRLARLRTTRPQGGAIEAVQDLRYHYDIAGNVIEIRDEAQQTVFFGNAVVEPHQAFEYDADYRLVTATGREHASHGQPTQVEHPPQSLPDPNDPQALRRYTEHYRYDVMGNIVRVRHEAPGGNWTRRYRYDELGNRLLATSAPADPADQHSHVYSYNAHGSMTAMPHLPAVEWDHAEQMRHVDLVGGGNVWFLYDAGGTRVRKVHRNSTGATRTERIYLRDVELYREYVGDELRRERQTLHVVDGTARVCMLETLTVDEGAVRPDAAPIVRYQYGNHLGSTAIELDGDARLISYEEFHPYGTTAYRAANSEVEVSPSRYRYTGQERDEETGLGHHGARYYAAWLGRWTAADPIGLGDGPNRYRYCDSRPSSRVDIHGCSAQSPRDFVANHTMRLLTNSPSRHESAASSTSESARETPYQPRLDERALQRTKRRANRAPSAQREVLQAAIDVATSRSMESLAELDMIGVATSSSKDVNVSSVAKIGEYRNVEARKLELSTQGSGVGADGSGYVEYKFLVTADPNVSGGRQESISFDVRVGIADRVVALERLGPHKVISASAGLFGAAGGQIVTPTEQEFLNHEHGHLVVAARTARAVTLLGEQLLHDNGDADPEQVRVVLTEIANEISDRTQAWYHGQVTPSSHREDALGQAADRTKALIAPTDQRIEDAVRTNLLDVVRRRSRKLSRVLR